MNFIIPYYDDNRMKYTSKYLENKGYHEVYDKKKADFAIFAPAQKSEKIEEYGDCFIFLGASKLDKDKYKFYDYNKREDFKYKNAMLTSEGAIALYKENSNKGIFESSILITGYGRIGKALLKALKSFGANVTVCVRSDINKAEAIGEGANVIDFSHLNCKGYDAVFNTVPAVCFTKKEIDTFDKGTKYIELASFPGGIDKHYVKAKNIDCINASKLPSRYSEESAGYYIGEVIDKAIKEGNIWISDTVWRVRFALLTKRFPL